jgi:hypothetical protein
MRKLSLYIKKNAFIFFLLPSLLGGMFFIFIPFIDSFGKSFFSAGSDEFVGLSNYIGILNNEAFVLAVKNTILFTVTCIPLLIIISFFIAYELSKIKCKIIIKSILLFPLAVPTAVLVIIWQILFCDMGYVNKILTDLGGERISFLNSSASFWLLVGGYIWKNIGYTVIIWEAGFMGISDSVIGAAKVDGGSEWQILTKIIMPLLKPTLYTISIISFLNSFKVFREAYLVAGSYPHESSYLIQHIFNNWFLNLDIDKMAAASVLVFFVIFIAITILRRLWDSKEE